MESKFETLMQQIAEEKDEERRKQLLEEIQQTDEYKELMDRISSAFYGVKRIIVSAWQFMKVAYEPLMKRQKQYERYLRVSSYKKSKSQRKNWGKWKKRK